MILLFQIVIHRCYSAHFNAVFVPCSHWIDMDWGLDSMDSGPEMGTQHIDVKPHVLPCCRQKLGFNTYTHLQICILCMYIRIFMYPCHFGKKIRIYNYNTRKSEVQGNFPTRLVANWEAHTIYNLMLTVQLWLVPGIFTICVWPFKLLVVFRHPSSKYQGGSKTKDVSHFLAFQLCVPSHIWWNPQSVVSKLGKLPPLVHS